MNTEEKGPLLRRARADELQALWTSAFENPEWKRFDAPYFPWEPPTLEAFEGGLFQRFLLGQDAQVIEVCGQLAGQVTAHWENESTRWLEIGIALYRSGGWGKGVGRRALSQWVTQLFHVHDLERIGLTTWSGNERMLKCALSAGFTLEGRLRKCRYYQGVYYDSLKLGVLREEWCARPPS